MSHTNQLLVDHGLTILFAVVFLEQIGLPLPGSFFLLAAGALSAAGKFNLPAGLGFMLVACLLADSVWFYLGRHRGHHVLGFLCRLSLEPDSCIRRTQNSFSRYGAWGLVAAKFLPGFSTVAPPLAGMSGIGLGPFLVADGAGSLLYGICFLGLGFLFGNQLDRMFGAMSKIGSSALVLLLALVAIYIILKFLRRQLLLRQLRMARITPEELRKKQLSGEDLVILDLRADAEFERDRSLIEGAMRFGVNELEQRHHEIPRDRDVIVYCSCPNEVTSARVALLLRRKGITRIRPLLGGINAWRDLAYPLSVLALSPRTDATSAGGR
jgi:membrane protein DedA with SNARE-associated domain/rhodanese-related sulfurtransferase